MTDAFSIDVFFNELFTVWNTLIVFHIVVSGAGGYAHSVHQHVGSLADTLFFCGIVVGMFGALNTVTMNSVESRLTDAGAVDSDLVLRTEGLALTID